MLVKKYTCPTCGGNKVDEITTGYVYCDYCSSLVNYDLEKMLSEAEKSFSSEQQNEIKQKYYKKLQELSNYIQSEDTDNFVKTQCEIHALEFELFPKRFSPKIKQATFRQKLLEYFESFWYEKMENGYFAKNNETQKLFSELSSKVTFGFKNGKSVPKYDEHFEKYIEEMSSFLKISIEETLNMTSIKKYPEPITSTSKDVMYKQSFNMTIQMYDTDTIHKLIEKFGLKTEYIEVSNLQQTKTKCFVCNHEISIPEGAKKKVCENCGTTNDIENQKVQCYACGASFSIAESFACTYCGSKVQVLGKKTKKDEVVKETSKKKQEEQKIDTSKNNKKGFFQKLFN